MSKSFTLLWRNKYLTLEATTIGEMAARLEVAARELRDMEAAGVILDGGPDGGVQDDYAHLTTEDPEVAQRFGMEEDEFEEEEEGE